MTTGVARLALRTAVVPGLPRPRFDHLRRLTDDTGVIQHALGPVPDRRTGYTTDDNARALSVVLRAARSGLPAELDLAERYLAFLVYAQEDDGGFHNFFAYDRRPLPEEPSEDCHGRALRALVDAVEYWRGQGPDATAARLLERALPRCRRLAAPRGLAHVALACAQAVERWPKDDAPLPRAALAELLEACAGALAERYRAVRGPGWFWFEEVMTYENAVLPQALICAGRVLGRRACLEDGLEALRFLCAATFPGGTFRPVGNRGWYPRGGRPAAFDQQPLEAAATVEACLEAYRATGDADWLRQALAAARWFTGDNVLGVSLLDPISGGCYDGLTPEGVNRNQGAESTLAWLAARVALLAEPLPAHLLAR